MKQGQRSTNISVKGVSVSVVSFKEGDYISLTDMLQAKEGDFFISDWLRNRNTVEFLGVWESVYNPDFNYGEFAIIKSQAGLNSYKLSVKDWVMKTGAVGLRATAGKYGGTYAHKDIAFEFGMWISAEFKIYLIKEFQRLKEDESRHLSASWNLNRVLSKLNYRIHTDAIKAYLIPSMITEKQAAVVYASEADVLNVALFGLTAAQWRAAHTDLEGNMRDYSSIEQLLVLANIESMNAELIHMQLNQGERLKRLNGVAIRQMQSLSAHVVPHHLRRLDQKVLNVKGIRPSAGRITRQDIVDAVRESRAR
ncbi:MAG: KilA-N domain-containing protein [Candidatus Omnitrophota bacterium]